MKSRGQEGFKYREVGVREDSNIEKSRPGRIQTKRSRGQGGFKYGSQTHGGFKYRV